MSGAPPWLPAQGYFGLMFLKHYTKLSDEKLLERFNTDWAMQMFCGVLLADNEMIRDNAFVSNVRTYLSKDIDFEAFQKSMINHWKLEIPDRKVALMGRIKHLGSIIRKGVVKILFSVLVPQLTKRQDLSYFLIQLSSLHEEVKRW